MEMCIQYAQMTTCQQAISVQHSNYRHHLELSQAIQYPLLQGVVELTT